jgi:hypothetical protein
MTPSAAKALIRSRLETEWAALHAAVPIFWPNENNQLPDPPFLHAEVRFGATRIAGKAGGLGTNLHRQSGELIVRVFEESLYGDTRADGYADEICTIFRTWQPGDLRFYTAAPAGGGTLNGNVFPVTVIASFDFDLIG